MKKFIYVVMSFFFAFSYMIIPENIRAANDYVISVTHTGIFADIQAPDGNHISDIGYIYANSTLVYCIEPLKYVDTGNVLQVSDLLTQNQKEKISIISYAGYNKQTRNTPQWYVATQCMIWEYLGTNFTFRNFPDYQNYKNEINKRISEYEKLPSFNSQKVTLYKNEKQTLVDTNKVLSLFSNIKNDGDSTMSIQGNDLSLFTSSNKAMNGKISIAKFNENQLGLPIVYRDKDDSAVQAVIYPQISKNIEGSIEYRTQPYGYLNFTKLGEVLQQANISESAYGNVYTPIFNEANLNNVKANLYAKNDIYDVWGTLIYKKDVLIDTLISKDVTVQSKKLIVGDYYLKEIETIDGYVLNQNEYNFTISKDNEEIDIQNIVMTNERSKINLNFTKKFEEGSKLDLSEAYKDVVIGVYTKNDIYSYQNEKLIDADSLVYISGINEDGSLLTTIDLPLGSYYLKELNTNSHFILDNNIYYFEVIANGQTNIDVTINDGEIVNQLHRNLLKVYKIDGSSKKPLQAKFVLYDQDLNEIKEFKTNKEGVYEFENLVDGIYYIQEIETSEGYKLDSRIHKVELNEDLTITLKNNKKVVNASLETNDNANHKPLELSIIASMSVMYLFLIKKVF